MYELNQVLDKPFRVICIDASNIDDKIDIDQRVVEGREYIVTNIFTNLVGEGENAFKLLGNEPYPYRGYGAHRFKIVNLHSVN